MTSSSGLVFHYAFTGYTGSWHPGDSMDTNFCKQMFAMVMRQAMNQFLLTHDLKQLCFSTEADTSFLPGTELKAIG